MLLEIRKTSSGEVNEAIIDWFGTCDMDIQCDGR
jgi:hypothetical protein